jgi:large-conductance mechanosensitive channel
MTIELNEYGLMIDLGDFLYVSLGWAFIILTALVIVGVKVYNKIKNKRVADTFVTDTTTNDLWSN